MIKKAVLLTVSAPFLMVFSQPSYSASGIYYQAGSIGSPASSPSAACSAIGRSGPAPTAAGLWCTGTNEMGNTIYTAKVTSGSCDYTDSYCNTDPDYPDLLANNPNLLPKKTDEQCQSENSGTYNGSASAANYLASGGSVKTAGGACTVSSGGGVTACTGTDDNITCSVPIEASSTGEYGEYVDGEYIESLGDGGTFSVVDFNTPEYLEPLPGGCSDPSSCVTIGDTSYLVDWDSAPDYFSYVDSNGTTHSKSSGGGGSGGDTGGGDNGGGNPTDPTDPGDDNGGGDSGGDAGGGDDSGNDDSDDNDGSGGSGGGSTVPDFEFDESGIIEAIRSSGQSNRNSIDALSNDITGALSDQTREINEQIDFSSFTINDSINAQTIDVTDALNDQTGTLTDSLDALGTTFTDALKGLGLGSGDDDSGDGDGEGEGEDGEGDGLLDGISKLLNKMVDKLASRFTEDLGDGDDLFDSSGMDETLDGVALQEQEHGDEINSLMDEIGDGASSDIAEQITSRLPSLPTGGCVPLQFGPMEISCQSFNTIKLWLTWIIYFWTVVSIVDTFFRSEQRTA